MISIASILASLLWRPPWGLDVVSTSLHTAAATATAMVVLRHQGLYLARVSSQRMLETRGIMRACFAAAVATTALASAPQLGRLAVYGLVFLVTSGALLFTSRGIYRSWLAGRRRSGAYVRPLLVVGANEEAAEFVRLFEEHPELGFRVVGVLGNSLRDDGLPRVGGRVEDATRIAENLGVNGAVVVATALTAPQLHSITRSLLAAGVHVHVSSGLAGLSKTRVRPMSFAHEAVLYLEPPALRGWQIRLKRAIDIAVAATALLVSLPLWAVIAAAIKLDDDGPVFFSQQRVGIGGGPFLMLKFRTMVPDAEARVGELRLDNAREDGPLFKMSHDPRITRVGRFLRATSLDELPQLVNVLSGAMSLVGPRPALATEVAQFDDELKARLRVKPGITGLWQIEARDHPSFGPYRRLDLFYVENWSLTLDLLILLGTVTSVVSRMLNSFIPSLRSRAAVEPL